ncbi:MAG: phosphoribosylanthranilate isomerase [Phaeodactylibacter sp.]|nr:phosphoribosylanthranilate isomerase [Phaeodactylibacter sp.]MCB9303902.1 phosphoribosylanthranilate isomerase [Lewinellaceae bacterium]HQU59133.1 phosphoribosylanthranilate isomerase [Saprospiraceae bacterium]
MQIKVCGMREPDNIKALASLPVDMIGFIFYRKSPRFIGEKLGRWLAQQGPLLEGKKRVGVFVNAEVEEVLNAVHDYELHYVQLHGEESPEYCQLLRTISEATSMRKFQIIKAFRIGEAFDFGSLSAFTPYCAYFLFDTKGAAYGGTGEQFDWGQLQQYHGVTPFLLSGGIGPESVAALRAFRHPQCYGVDINSRFETAPGLKDIEKITAFIHELNN